MKDRVDRPGRWGIATVAAIAALTTVGPSCAGQPASEPAGNAPGPAGTAPAPADDPTVTTGTGLTRSPTGSSAPGDQLSVPHRLRIGQIGVDAAVVPVGVEPDGEMEVPGATEAGWYRFGPAPGERGSAVLAAHVDFDGRPGAFFRLRELRSGELVEVDMTTGPTRRFRVTQIERFPKDALPDERVFGRDGQAGLALITCGGDFDGSARSYRDNIVAFAVPEP